MSSCSLAVRLKPRAKNDRITIGSDGLIELAVTSPPVDGKANQHLIRLLADRLDLPKSAICLIKGEHARSKAVAVTGLDKEECLIRLRHAAHAGLSKGSRSR